jgi:hypothetical protein
MSAYHPILKKQHEAISETLRLAGENWKSGHYGASMIFMDQMSSLLREHHKTECELLFDKVAARHEMREGGPFCSYFYSFFMENRPRDRAEKLISELRGRPFTIEIPAHLQAYFEGNSLFCIPLEEHLAIQTIAQGLTQALMDPNPKIFAWIERSLSALKDLIEANIQKEETCLWVAVHQITDPQLHAELATKS